MSSRQNLVILRARIVKDPEVKTVSRNGSQLRVVDLCCITTREKHAGGTEEVFFIADAWNGQAEAIAANFGKGQEVLVTGSLKSNSWEAPGGGRTHGPVRISIESVAGIAAVPDGA